MEKKERKRLWRQWEWGEEVTRVTNKGGKNSDRFHVACFHVSSKLPDMNYGCEISLSCQTWSQEEFFLVTHDNYDKGPFAFFSLGVLSDAVFFYNLK